MKTTAQWMWREWDYIVAKCLYFTRIGKTLIMRVGQTAIIWGWMLHKNKLLNGISKTINRVRE